MGLREKLLLTLLVVLVTGAGFAAVYLGWNRRDVLVGEAEARGRALLEAMRAPCASAIASDEFERADTYLVEVGHSDGARELDLEHIGLLDHTGKIYAHSDPRRFGERPTDEWTLAIQEANTGRSRILARPGEAALLEVSQPLVNGPRWGTLIAGFSMASHEAVLSRENHQFAWAGLGAAVFCGVVLFLLLTRFAVRPLGQLAQAAEALGEGELERRVTVAGKDEVGRLGAAFNRMADQLGAKTARLEREVSERTAKLLRANQDLSRVNARLEEVVAELEQIAVTDGLTGIYNRRRFEEVLSFEAARAKRQNLDLSLLMIDVDHFKHYNDRHGHPAGDAVLKRLAGVFVEKLRSVDLVARYGGEEFVVLLLDTGLRGGRVVAEKICRAIAAERFRHGADQPEGRLTVSIGLASCPTHTDEPETLIELADRALYRAKRAGRNRVEVWTGEDPGGGKA